MSHRVESVAPDYITVWRNGRKVDVARYRAVRMRLTNPKCSECGKVGSHRELCSKRRGVGL